MTVEMTDGEPPYFITDPLMHPIKSIFCDEVTGGVLSKVKRKLGLQKVSKMGRRVMIPYHLTMYLPYFILHVLP
ncbi:uncharacterized protein LOC143246757 isoform X3 [Tachypleus tridentatus]|uniref:uncharacterized protein LOC143246757 isoform X3 n=1 Tax=Tachypleus tridentatus TaxID=6853 RepID=UPI003FD0349A